MTLVELLVVITIMTLLMAVTLPRLRPMMENRNVRESARAVSVFLIQARTRAMETGRPCGVLFERASDRNQPNACVTLRQVEVPAAYGGTDIGTTITLGSPTSLPGDKVQVVATLANGSTDGSLIQIGDFVQINYQGQLYQITGKGATATGFPLTLETYIGPNGTVPWPTQPSVALPFKIFRQPSAQAEVAFASVAPSLQLFRQAAVDLRWSGTGVLDDDPLDPTPDPNKRHVDNFRAQIATDDRPVVVMFSPNGSIDSVTYINPATLVVERKPVTDPIFFLIGRMDRVDLDLLPDDGFNNYEDLNNSWLAINPQTGLITTSEPAAVPSGSTNPVNDSRVLARQTQISKGGR